MLDLYYFLFSPHPLIIYEKIQWECFSNRTNSYTMLNKFINNKVYKYLCVYYFSYLYQQHPPDFFFSSAAALFYVNFAPPLYGTLGLGVFSFQRLALTCFAIVQKASFIFVPSFAEVSKNGIPKDLANASPSSLVTCLLGISTLLPKITG